MKTPAPFFAARRLWRGLLPMMRLRLLRLGLALVAAAMLGLFVGGAVAQDMGKGPRLPRTPTPEITPVPGATPTVDRLAAPPTVAAPTQADEGAQLYWLHCQPCHGDHGQGLTDEWRAQYPPEDQNCWNSGCHGPRPYDPAFKLPTRVPALVGDHALARFPTLDGVYRYVSVAMPYFFPGDLTQEEYLAILAHLARENGIGDGRPLTSANLAGYPIPWALAQAATPTPPMTSVPPSTPTPVSGRAPSGSSIGVGELAIIVVCILIPLLIGGIALWLRRGRSI